MSKLQTVYLTVFRLDNDFRTLKHRITLLLIFLVKCFNKHLTIRTTEKQKQKNIKTLHYHDGAFLSHKNSHF